MTLERLKQKTKTYPVVWKTDGNVFHAVVQSRTLGTGLATLCGALYAARYLDAPKLERLTTEEEALAHGLRRCKRCWLWVYKIPRDLMDS